LLGRHFDQTCRISNTTSDLHFDHLRPDIQYLK
jgi:hypothetical protein